jgi:hypothetical protein
MSATYSPIKCPHGSDLLNLEGVVTVYYDGCRATSGTPARFWCGEDEMSKPRGVSITEGEYLRDWQAAHQMNHIFNKHTEALAENSLRTIKAAGSHEWWTEGEYYDRTPERELDICNWCGGLAQLVDGACRGCAESAKDHRAGLAKAHAAHLGEVPWSDRVDD